MLKIRTLLPWIVTPIDNIAAGSKLNLRLDADGTSIYVNDNGFVYDDSYTDTRKSSSINSRLSAPKVF